MRSLGARRVAPAAGAAMIAVVALAGCSAGQVAETALLKAPVSGLNTQSPDGTLLIRNLQVLYNGPEGYPANGVAPIEVSLFNQTEQPMTVVITSRPQQDVVAGVVSAQLVGVGPAASAASTSPAPDPSASTSPAPDPSASTSPAPDPSASAAAEPSTGAQPAKFTIAPLSSETFLPGDTESLQAAGLSNRLRPGVALSLTIQASTLSQPIEVLVPFGVPASAGSRAPGIEGENAEE